MHFVAEERRGFVVDQRLLWVATFVIVGIVILWLYLRHVPYSPPCCFADEPSTYYNAYLIETTGHDEWHAHLPLFFKAFGDYKSPVEIYLAAVLFKIFGPSLTLARSIAPTAIFVAVATTGIVAYRWSGKRSVGVIVFLTGLMTPWLFEIGRLGTEAALMTVPAAVFLLFLYGPFQGRMWKPRHILGLGTSLALMAYTYPVGRLLSVLLAVGLLLGARRSNIRQIAMTWVLYACLLVPMGIYNLRHPGALSARFSSVSWLGGNVLNDVSNFVTHYWLNIDPTQLLFTGDPQLRQHIPWLGSYLLASAVVAGMGMRWAWQQRRVDAWSRYLIYGLLVAWVPATLTFDIFHTARLIAVPIFLLLLSVPALSRLTQSGRHGLPSRLLITLLSLSVLQAIIFYSKFVTEGQNAARVDALTADFIPAFNAALSTGRRPIWLLDAPFQPPTHIFGEWFGVLDHLPRSDLVRWVRPPVPRGEIPDAARPTATPGAVVVGGSPCNGCPMLFRGPNFSTWIQVDARP